MLDWFGHFRNNDAEKVAALFKVAERALVDAQGANLDGSPTHSKRLNILMLKGPVKTVVEKKLSKHEYRAANSPLSDLISIEVTPVGIRHYRVRIVGWIDVEGMSIDVFKDEIRTRLPLSDKKKEELREGIARAYHVLISQ